MLGLIDALDEAYDKRGEIQSEDVWKLQKPMGASPPRSPKDKSASSPLSPKETKGAPPPRSQKASTDNMFDSLGRFNLPLQIFGRGQLWLPYITLQV